MQSRDLKPTFESSTGNWPATENTNDGCSLGSQNRFNITVKRVITIERHAWKQVMNGMQILTQPQPLKRLHPPGHNQTIGILVAGRSFIRMMRAVCKPVRRKKGPNRYPNTSSTTTSEVPTHTPYKTRQATMQTSSAK